MSERKHYTVNAIDAETGKRDGRTLTVSTIERVCGRDIVRIQATDPESCEWGGVAFLPVGVAADFGREVMRSAGHDPREDAIDECVAIADAMVEIARSMGSAGGVTTAQGIVASLRSLKGSAP